MIRKRLLSPFLMGLILLLCQQWVYAQNKTIMGVVRSDAGTPLPGASVIAKGQAGGVTTDNLGAFRITVGADVSILVISYIGFADQEVAIGSQSAINVSLLPGTKGALDEVIVVGYGTQRKKDVTGAIGSVKGEAIKNMPVTNVAEALQGRVAGVEVIKATGEPGAPTQITIRGVSSLNQPQPLYIVDGIRQSGDNINVQDIATIDIMKDASAASIYGSAAAGGVIIITTKKGQGGKPSVNLNARYGLTKPRVMKLLGRDDFVKVKQLTLDGNYVGRQQIDTLPDTDWVDEIFRNGTESNYNLSVSGASPAVNYFVSGFYNNQKGIYLDNKSSLAGVRLNTDIKLGNKIKIGEQIYAWQRSTNPIAISPINPPFRSVPIMPVYSGKPENPWGQQPPGFVGPNLVAQIMTADKDFKQTNFQGNVFAEIKLPLYLTFRTTLGYTYYNEEDNYYQAAYSTGPVSVPANSLSKRTGSTRTTFYNYILSFDHSYGKHSINALAGYEQFSSKFNGITTSSTFVGGSSYAYLVTSESVLNISNGGYDPNGLVKSLFGRVNYDFDKKYFGSFSIRRDGNFTVFGPGNQYGIFPAGSVGWRISEEPFFQSALPVFNSFKLRGSYGVLGNSNIEPYLFLSAYDYANAQNFSPGGSPTLNYSQNNIANPNIKWESLYETNVGFDAEAMNGRFTFSLDWYNKTTKDMLYGLPIPASVGMPGGIFKTNIGSVRNRGWEFSLGYNDASKDFTYSILVNGAFNKNKVLNLDNINDNPILSGDNNYGNATFGIMVNQPLTYTKAGLSFGQFYGYKVEGIYQNAEQIAGHPQQEGYTANIGDLIYADMNKDGKINDQDRTTIGNPYPKFVYGANINLGWKGFDLVMLFNGVAGIDLFNGVAPYAMSLFSDGNTTSKVFNASYLGDNELTGQPRIGVINGNSFTADPNHNYSYASSYFVESGSYLKLKNLQLGYNFTGSWLKKASVQKARLYFMANNLFCITGYNGIDPELGSQNILLNGGVNTRGIDAPWRYPNARIYSVGLDLNF